MIVPIIEIPFYSLFLLSVLVTFYAQFKVKYTFSKYSREPSASGRCAAEVAKMILAANGISDVKIERVGGNLTDHYDPRSKTLRLSDAVYSSSSVAAIGVAAHEAGHAIQHAKKYFPLVLRRVLVPVATFSSRMTWPTIIIGCLINIFAASDFVSELGFYIIIGGVALFGFAGVFQLVTLPCEFNASRRAIRAMRDSGWYSSDEIASARSVLAAAALTYVAALFSTVVHFIRLLLIIGRNRRHK